MPPRCHMVLLIPVKLETKKEMRKKSKKRRGKDKKMARSKQNSAERGLAHKKLPQILSMCTYDEAPALPKGHFSSLCRPTSYGSFPFLSPPNPLSSTYKTLRNTAVAYTDEGAPGKSTCHPQILCKKSKSRNKYTRFITDKFPVSPYNTCTDRSQRKNPKSGYGQKTSSALVREKKICKYAYIIEKQTTMEDIRNE